MNRESQFGCDRDFVEILGQAKALPNMARPNDEEVAGVTKPLRLSSFEGVKVERNARNKGWLPVILRSSTFRIPPLPDVAMKQGKLNFNGGSQCPVTCGPEDVQADSKGGSTPRPPPIQSKRTSPILVEGNRVAIHRMGDWEWRLSLLFMS